MGKLIAYTEQERETVRSGFAAVKAVLTGSDSEQKRSLLLCLDWFMDPYYGHSGEIAGWRSELKDLLQNLILQLAVDLKDGFIVHYFHLLRILPWSRFPLHCCLL